MKSKHLFGWLLCAAVLLWLLWGNSALEVSRYSIASPRLPAEFEGFRIAQISDLHNEEFGRSNEILLRRLEDAAPDIIVLTGDLVDSRDTQVDIALAFAGQAVKIAPCYYVTGNHEARIKELPDLLEGLAAAGVTVLRNEAVKLERHGGCVTLLGVDDPNFAYKHSGEAFEKSLRRILSGWQADGQYTILLSHHPELFTLYAEMGMELVFSGHAHGGQFRLPFVGGIIAPDQGLFPEYDAGVYQSSSTAMVVSRGLGGSIIPLRIHNRPELVVAELHRQEA